jgi:cyclopropane fatty-acyl-phospholipid synthase-like methyltransferase
MIQLNEAYWTERWKNHQTGWDIGFVSTPIKEYVDQLENKELKILIPGCGNAYEGEYLMKHRFKNTHLIDISQEALNSFKKRFPSFPEENLHHGDFFNHQEKYDLVIEQTFFCALNPELRKDYVTKMHDTLTENGKLVGVLFHDKLFDDHPPFGGFLEEYKALFASKFFIHKMEMCKNSIEPRLGREVFINLKKVK